MKIPPNNKAMTPIGPAQCPTCHGKKTLPVVVKGIVTADVLCPLCKGSGVGKYAIK